MQISFLSFRWKGKNRFWQISLRSFLSLQQHERRENHVRRKTLLLIFNAVHFKTNEILLKNNIFYLFLKKPLNIYVSKTFKPHSIASILRTVLKFIFSKHSASKKLSLAFHVRKVVLAANVSFLQRIYGSLVLLVLLCHMQYSAVLKSKVFQFIRDNGGNLQDPFFNLKVSN